MGEPFPQTTSSIRPLIKHENAKPRLRRRSSNLPSDPRGDTGNIAVSTSHLATRPRTESPASPGAKDAQTSKSSRPRGHKRRKAKSMWRRYKKLALTHTWITPLIALAIILALYAVNPSPSNPIHRMIFLSYALPRSDPLAVKQYTRTPYWATTTQYGKGGADFAFVTFYVIVLSFTREFIMQRLLRPWAVRAGIKSRAKQARFMEQAYTALYFAIFGPFGLYVMYRSPVWYFDTTNMFVDFPHRTHEGYFKAYYLLQAAYWAQQAIVLVLQLEKPRKDFKELVLHHVVTVALIWLSYRFHFTYMGLAVYITHDVSDFFLATSKILNYLSSPLVVPYFTTFIAIWAYCRHYLNLLIIYATFTKFRTIGPFELNWETQQYKCWISQPITLALLISIQSLNLFWFFLILRIAYNIVLYDKKEDERSEYGSEDEADGESTREKRERMGKLVEEKEGAAAANEVQHLKANGHATPKHVKSVEAPTLLVNGESTGIEDSPAGNTRSSSRRRRKA